MSHNEVITQIIIPVMAILCSGIISTIITHRLNSSRQEQVFLRSKLEELFLAFHYYSNSIVTYHLKYIKVMKEEISYDDALDLEIEWSKQEKNRDGHQNLFMLITIYFHDFKPLLDKLFGIRDDMMKIQHSYKRQYKQGNTDGRIYVQPLVDLLSRIDPLLGKFDQVLQKEAIKIR